MNKMELEKLQKINAKHLKITFEDISMQNV